MSALLPLPVAARPGPPLQLRNAPNAVGRVLVAAGEGGAGPDVSTETPDSPPPSARLVRAVERLPAYGLRFEFEIAGPTGEIPRLADGYDYRMDIDAAGGRVRVAASTDWGAIAALATLAQLAADGRVEVARIEDSPRYPWRGVMIDTVRHFITLETLRRTLDAMWFYKLNVLHLHLTDDQGFRFGSEAFPELASAEAYSAAELRALVAYAADRAIRVIPELDVPGHVASWLAAHPEWGSKTSDVFASSSKRFGVHRAALDVGNPEVVAAVAALLDELAGVFPDECVHFGGDEVATLPPDEQYAFHRTVVDHLAGLGKRSVGWDEALSPTLPKAAIVQAWRGAGARDAAVAAGYDCVVSAPYYLDLFYPADAHYAADPDGDLVAAEAALAKHPRLAHVREGLAWMLAFPAFPDLAERPPGRVLGGEACLWSELVTDELLDTRLWSRMPAVAERLWSADSACADTASLYERMAKTRSALAALCGVAEDKAPADIAPGLRPLIEMLEPVKWYRRLLGADEYAHRVDGVGASTNQRPYNTETPLARIVDRLPPESLRSRSAEADLAAGAAMDAWTAPWRQQRVALASYPALQAELGAASEALAALADVVDGRANTDPAKLAGPFGEYLLPVAYAVARG